MTQPAEQTDFRYFRDKDGTRWKMPTDNTLGYVWAHDEWHLTKSRLSGLTQPTNVRLDGTIETDATGEPLAPAAPGGEQSESVKVFRYFKCDCPGNHQWRFSGDNWQDAETFIDGRWETWKTMTLEELDRPHFYEFTPEAVEPSPPAGGGEKYVHAYPPEPIAELGDAVADVFDQMLKGNWVDDHGHPVKNNTAMVDLRGKLSGMCDHIEAVRSKPTSSTPPPAATPGGAPETPSEGRTFLQIAADGNDIALTNSQAVDLIRCIAELERESAGLRELLRELKDAIERVGYETGVCCCGGEVTKHTISDGHSPVDSGAHFMGPILAKVESALAGGEEGSDV